MGFFKKDDNAASGDTATLEPPAAQPPTAPQSPVETPPAQTAAPATPPTSPIPQAPPEQPTTPVSPQVESIKQQLSDDVERVLLSVAADEEQLAMHPAPKVHFKSFGDSSLDFELRCWIDEPEAREQIVDRLNRSLYEQLGEAGIEIPFPKRDVYIKELPANISQTAS